MTYNKYQDKIYETTCIKEIEDFLIEGLKEMKISVSQSMVEQFIHYIFLVIKWKRVFNLTSIKDPYQIIIRHIFDSLSINPFLKGDKILDVGTGAGFPGIPLAIVNPNYSFTLIDSNTKKYTFLMQVVHELGLSKRVIVRQERIETFNNHVLFDTIVSRAFSSIKDILFFTYSLCKPNGQFLIMKGTYPITELSDFPRGFDPPKIYPLTVPRLEAERCLICVKLKSNKA